jgi:hypothetical protein
MRLLVGFISLTLGICLSFAEAADPTETLEIVYRRYIRLLREDSPDEAKPLIAKIENFTQEAVEDRIDHGHRIFRSRTFEVRTGKTQGDCALVLVCEDSDVDPGYCLKVDGRWKVVPWDLEHSGLGLTEKQKADFAMLKAWFKANELALKQKYTLPRRDR